MEVTVSFAINFYANKDTQDLPSPASSEFLISFWPSLCITQREHFTQQGPLDPVGLWQRALRNTRHWAAHWQLRLTVPLILLWHWGSEPPLPPSLVLEGTRPKNFFTLRTVRRLNTRRRLKTQEDCQKLFTVLHCTKPPTLLPSLPYADGYLVIIPLLLISEFLHLIWSLPASSALLPGALGFHFLNY